MKKFLAFLLAVCMLFALTACGGGKTNNEGTDNPGKTDSQNGTESGGDKNTSEKKDSLSIAFSQDRGTLDPMYMIGYDGLNAMRMIYETLWDWNSAGEQEWILATGIDYVSDTVWHIHIREGVKFSNGNPLTAEDVVFSLDKANHRTGEPEYLPQLDLENTKALDDYTVEFVLKSYDLSYIYSMSSLCIFDKESYDEQAIAQNPIGTGPYKLDDYVVNSHINLSLRDEYWGEMPSIKNMYFKVYAEDSQKTNALQTGDVDICNVPFQDVEYIKGLGTHQVAISAASQGRTRTLYFNATENSILCNNPDARKAIAMAIDTEAIADIAYSGYATPARMACSVDCVDADESLFDYGVYGTGYDPEGAKALAEKAGIVGKTLSISTNGTSDAIVTAELIQSDLNAIGINVEINNYDSGSWLSVAFDPTAAGDMLVDFTGVPSMTVSQNISCWYLYHLGGGYTTCPFENKDRMDEISAMIMSTKDEAKLKEMNAELIKIQTDAMLWYNLCDLTTATAYTNGLEGFDIMVMGNINYAKLSWAD